MRDELKQAIGTIIDECNSHPWCSECDIEEWCGRNFVVVSETDPTRWDDPRKEED